MSQKLNARIAIVIPTYNSSSTIAHTLQSLMAQREYLQRISTVFIADDNSSDDTLNIVRTTWESAIPLQILESSLNRGERDNINRTVDLICNQMDWMLILHSDDVVKPNWLELILHRIGVCDSTVGSICSSWDEWLPDGTIIAGEDNIARPVEVIRADSAAVRSTLMRGCWWHVSGCAIRLKAFQQVGRFNPDMPQLGDWDWLLRCLGSGWSVEYLPRTLIRYRQHQASVSSVSFRTDRDLRESLVIVAQYSHLFIGSQLLFWHVRRSSFCVRRLARAVMRLDLARCRLCLKTLALVTQNYLRLREASSTRNPGEIDC